MGTMAGLDSRSGTDSRPVSSLASAVNRWMFVCMAAGFVLLTLVGFVPDSLAKIAAVQAGQRPPFPPILHVHALFMGAFLLVLLAQAILGATGNLCYHRRLGVLGALLVPAIVATGVVLVPTMFHQVWQAAQVAPAKSREALQGLVLVRLDILLLQLRMALLFPVFMALALRARATDPAFHKRMMFLAVAIILPPSIDRIAWLPTTFPASAVATDLYALLTVAPMFLWDRLQNPAVWKPYVVWIAVNAPLAAVVHALWGTQAWHAFALRLMLQSSAS